MSIEMLGPFQMPFVQRGLVEVLVLSVGTGLLGTWIILRGLAFYSHAVGVAAFPGLVLASGLGFAPPIGAFGMAVLFTVGLERLARSRRRDYDVLTALVLVGALVAGVILASDVFHSGSNIDTLLFGSLLVIGPSDIVLAAMSSVLALAAIYFLGRVWLATGFDPSMSRSLGIRTAVPDVLLLGLVALVATAAVSTIGALLTTTLLIVPAASVRLLTWRLFAWQLGSVVLTFIEGTIGLWVSVETNAPPGATIALVAGCVFLLLAAVRAISSSLSAPPPRGSSSAHARGSQM